MRKMNLLALAALFAAGMCASAFAGEDTVRKVVMFKKDAQVGSATKGLVEPGWHVTRTMKNIKTIVVEMPKADALKLEMKISSRAGSDVMLVEDDFYGNWLKFDSSFREKMNEAAEDITAPAMSGFAVETDENDPEIPWGVAKVGAPKVWSKWTGKGVKVGVVDTGVDLSHPDLAANIVKTINIITGGNGQDDQGHGTHVSGTIAAVRDGKGVVGVAPEASLYVAKVLGSNGSGTLSDVVAGIDWTVEQGVNVMNMSLGSPSPSEILGEAVKRAADAGIAVVCAAGNDGGPVGYPAAYPGAIAVSAGDESGGMASFSSHGPQIAFIAPGVNINSTYLGGTYKALRGTSMASPHVAGLAALAVQGGAKNADAVMKALKGAAKPSTGLENDQQGNGMINAGDIVVRKPRK